MPNHTDIDILGQPVETFVTEEQIGLAHDLHEPFDHDPFTVGIQKRPPKDWATATGPIQLPVLPSEGTYDPNFYCKIAVAHKTAHEEGCSILRRRVALWLLQQGCPSNVTAKAFPKATVTVANETACCPTTTTTCKGAGHANGCDCGFGV